MPPNLASALAYVVQALSSIVLVILLLRLLLPILRGDFRNPIAQGIMKITSPLVIPVRRVIPSLGRIDSATIVVILAIQLLAVWLVFTIHGISPPLSFHISTSVIKLAVLTINIFIFAIVIRIVISWIAPGQYSPITALVSTLSEPVLRPFRRVIPAVGGFDISPIFAIILLSALTIIVRGFHPLAF